MAQPVSVLASGVMAAGAPATGKITANTRVTTPAGPVGIISDVMQFPGPATVGNWIVGASRVMVGGVPVVNQTSTGTAFVPPTPATVPMTVSTGDARVTAL